MKKSIPLIVGILAFPAIAAASIPSPPGNITLPYNPQFAQPSFLGSFAQGVINWMFWGLIVFSIVMFLVGAYRYMTSAGEPEKVSKANRTLLYAVIALVVALLAEAVPFIIGNILGTPLGSSSNIFSP